MHDARVGAILNHGNQCLIKAVCQWGKVPLSGKHDITSFLAHLWAIDLDLVFCMKLVYQCQPDLFAADHGIKPVTEQLFERLHVAVGIIQAGERMGLHGVIKKTTIRGFV